MLLLKFYRKLGKVCDKDFRRSFVYKKRIFHEVYNMMYTCIKYCVNYEDSKKPRMGNMT